MPPKNLVVVSKALRPEDIRSVPASFEVAPDNLRLLCSLHETFKHVEETHVDAALSRRLSLVDLRNLTVSAGSDLDLIASSTLAVQFKCVQIKKVRPIEVDAKEGETEQVAGAFAYVSGDVLAEIITDMWTRVALRSLFTLWIGAVIDAQPGQEHMESDTWFDNKLVIVNVSIPRPVRLLDKKCLRVSFIEMTERDPPMSSRHFFRMGYKESFRAYFTAKGCVDYFTESRNFISVLCLAEESDPIKLHNLLSYEGVHDDLTILYNWSKSRSFMHAFGGPLDEGKCCELTFSYSGKRVFVCLTRSMVQSAHDQVELVVKNVLQQSFQPRRMDTVGQFSTRRSSSPASTHEWEMQLFNRELVEAFMYGGDVCDTELDITGFISFPLSMRIWWAVVANIGPARCNLEGLYHAICTRDKQHGHGLDPFLKCLSLIHPSTVTRLCLRYAEIDDDRTFRETVSTMGRQVLINIPPSSEAYARMVGGGGGGGGGGGATITHPSVCASSVATSPLSFDPMSMFTERARRIFRGDTMTMFRYAERGLRHIDLTPLPEDVESTLRTLQIDLRSSQGKSLHRVARLCAKDGWPGISLYQLVSRWIRSCTSGADITHLTNVDNAALGEAYGGLPIHHCMCHENADGRLFIPGGNIEDMVDAVFPSPDGRTMLFHGTRASSALSVLHGIDPGEFFMACDFGKGFYTTSDIHCALEFAIVSSWCPEPGPDLNACVIVYSIGTAELEDSFPFDIGIIRKFREYFIRVQRAQGDIEPDEIVAEHVICGEAGAPPRGRFPIWTGDPAILSGPLTSRDDAWRQYVFPRRMVRGTSPEDNPRMVSAAESPSPSAWTHLRPEGVIVFHVDLT